MFLYFSVTEVNVTMQQWATLDCLCSKNQNNWRHVESVSKVIDSWLFYIYISCSLTFLCFIKELTTDWCSINHHCGAMLTSWTHTVERIDITSVVIEIHLSTQNIVCFTELPLMFWLYHWLANGLVLLAESANWYCPSVLCSISYFTSFGSVCVCCLLQTMQFSLAQMQFLLTRAFSCS